MFHSGIVPNAASGIVSMSNIIFMRMGIYIVAICSILSLLFAEPQYSAYWDKLDYSSDLCTYLGNMHNAEQIAEKFRQNETPQTLFELGRLYFSRGLYRQALAFLQRTDFGGDTRLLLIGFCNIILDEPDSAKIYLAQITQPRLRAWSSAGLAKISKSIPKSVNDYPYIANFFTTIPRAADSSHTGGYTLQFGAFSDSLRANIMMKKLMDIGLSAYIQKTTIGDKILYRVRAEHFATKEDAENAGSALGDQFIYMVVPEQ